RSLQAVPNGRQHRRRGAVVDAVGLGGMLVKPVGISLRKDGREVVIANRPARARGAYKSEGALFVISDRVNVINLQPAVASSAVVFDASALIRVIRILKRTSLKIGQVMGRLKLSSEVGGNAAQPGVRWLPATSRENDRTSDFPSSLKRR